jgi:phosphate-selective porin OprO and OprP
MRIQVSVTVLFLASALWATAATNDEPQLSPADIRALLKRVQELEQKVQALEKAQGQTPQTNQDPRVQQLEQQVKVLERNRELDEEAAETKTKETPRITLGQEGFAFTSADTNFVIQLKGILQVDSRTFFGDSGIVGNDGILLRRARPILQGTVFRDFDFQFVPDFGGSGAPQIYDAWLNYRYSPELQLIAGKYKTPIGLEQLQADRDILFNERALPTDLVPNRDVGFTLHGDVVGGAVSYAVGIFNGVGDGRNSSNVDFDDNKEFAGRLFFQPFKPTELHLLQGLGFGLAGSFQAMQGTNTAGLPNNTSGSLSTPGYLTAGQQEFFAYNPTNRSVVAEGQHWRLAPQASWFYGPFGLMGEYVISDQQVALAGAGPRTAADLQHTAWQIQANWVLTGEDSSYSGVVPRHPFNPAQGGWGAWQLVARYSELDIDPNTFPLFSNPATSARVAHEWAVGLDWYLNRNIKLMGDYSHTEFTGGGGPGSSAPATVTRTSESVLFTRLQLAF